MAMSSMTQNIRARKKEEEKKSNTPEYVRKKGKKGFKRVWAQIGEETRKFWAKIASYHQVGCKLILFQ